MYTRESEIPEGLDVDPYFLVETEESSSVNEMGVRVSSEGKGTSVQLLNSGMF